MKHFKGLKRYTSFTAAGSSRKLQLSPEDLIALLAPLIGAEGRDLKIAILTSERDIILKDYDRLEVAWSDASTQDVEEDCG